MSILAALEQAPRLKRDDRGRVREKLFTDFPFDGLPRKYERCRSRDS